MRALLILLLVSPGMVWADASRSFDGTNDSVKFGDMASLEDQTALSAGCWIINSNLTQDHIVIDKSSSTTDRWFLFTDDVAGTSGRTNTYTWFVDESAVGSQARVEAASDSALQDTWQWIVGTFVANDSTGMRLYIGGVEDANSPVASTGVDNSGGNPGQLAVGESDLGSTDRAGLEAHCQAWNRTITLVEVNEAMWVPGRVPLNLQLYSPVWGDSTEVDLSGNGNVGTVAGAVASSSGPPIIIGDASL